MYLATEQAASHITHGKMENPDEFSSNHFPLWWTIGGKVIDTLEGISELKQLDVKKTSWDLIHGALKESIKEINILQNYPRNHKKIDWIAIRLEEALEKVNSVIENNPLIKEILDERPWKWMLQTCLTQKEGQTFTGTAWHRASKEGPETVSRQCV